MGQYQITTQRALRRQFWQEMKDAGVVGVTRKHWKETRGNTDLGNETFAILDCLKALAKIRGYKLED